MKLLPGLTTFNNLFDDMSDDSFFRSYNSYMKTDIKEKAPATPEGEGGDIASDLTHYMEILESQESLMFDGEPLDDESKELLLISLKNTMELAKKMKERKKSGLSDNK